MRKYSLNYNAKFDDGYAGSGRPVGSVAARTYVELKVSLWGEYSLDSVRPFDLLLLLSRRGYFQSLVQVRGFGYS